LAPPAAQPAPASTPPPVSAAPPPREVPETPEANSGATPPAVGTGAFLWPVRGHILATYGSKSDGTHNDGINIAAPRGTAVQAVDAGVVAYTGNELRGYGNLVLVKHANGWISAYAHCDAILVKRGEKVGRGQVIARVGSTGNVSEPQLHFELRRGQHAVDPREFMPPLPTAAANQSHPG
jgi:murein DD-endopeptidase MepM/ murein hydrolase activator NlpD